jgi:hypothetical protein
MAPARQNARAGAGHAAAKPVSGLLVTDVGLAAERHDVGPAAERHIAAEESQFSGSAPAQRLTPFAFPPVRREMN